MPAVLSRKRAVDYDQVLRKQRMVMYETRDRLLDGGTMEREKLMEIAWKNISDFIKAVKKPNKAEVSRFVLDNISYSLDSELSDEVAENKKTVSKYLIERVERGLEEQEERIGSKERMNNFIRIAILRAIDDAWVEQVDYLQQLQTAVSGRSMAQRNPVYEYQEEALESYCLMEKTILRNIMRNILLSEVSMDKKQKMHIVFP